VGTAGSGGLGQRLDAVAVAVDPLQVAVVIDTLKRAVQTSPLFLADDVVAVMALVNDADCQARLAQATGPTPDALAPLVPVRTVAARLARSTRLVGEAAGLDLVRHAAARTVVDEHPALGAGLGGSGWHWGAEMQTPSTVAGRLMWRCRVTKRRECLKCSSF
jgi:hypothetical protein